MRSTKIIVSAVLALTLVAGAALPAANVFTDDAAIVASAVSPEYYLMGNMNDWGKNDDYKLAPYEVDGVYSTDDGIYSITLELTTDSEFKIVDTSGESSLWYPEGMGNNYGENGEIAEDGTYTVLFRPDGNDDENEVWRIWQVPVPTKVEAIEPNCIEPGESLPDPTTDSDPLDSSSVAPTEGPTIDNGTNSGSSNSSKSDTSSSGTTTKGSDSNPATGAAATATAAVLAIGAIVAVRKQK